MALAIAFDSAMTNLAAMFSKLLDLSYQIMNLNLGIRPQIVATSPLSHAAFGAAFRSLCGVLTRAAEGPKAQQQSVANAAVYLDC